MFQNVSWYILNLALSILSWLNYNLAENDGALTPRLFVPVQQHNYNSMNTTAWAQQHEYNDYSLKNVCLSYENKYESKALSMVAKTP